MAAQNTLLAFTALHNDWSASSAATLDWRNYHPVLDFDATTTETALFCGVMPANYSGSGVNVILTWTSSATSGNAVLETSFERGNTDLDSDSFGIMNQVTGTTNGTSGITTTTTIEHSDGEQLDGIAAGELFQLRVRRIAESAADTLAADLELLAIQLQEAVAWTGVAPWRASSAALPGSMTLTRATTGLGLTGTSWNAATYTSHATNVARFERLPSEHVGLLIEGASTGVSERSSDLTNAAWGKYNITAAANTTAGPFTGTTADSLTETAVSGNHYFDQGGRPFAPTVPMVFSFIAKPGLRSRFRLRMQPNSGSGYVESYFDMTGVGSVFNTANTAPGSGAAGSIWLLPNGWYNVNLTGTPTTTGTDLYMQIVLVSTALVDNYLGSTASPAIWLQNLVLMQTGSVPLSPIEVVTGSVTRNADVTVQTISAAPSSFSFAVGGVAAKGLSGDQYFISIDDNSANNIVAIRRNSSGAMVLDVTAAGTLVASITGATVADGAEFTVAASIAVNDVGWVVNGVAATRDTSAAMPTGLVRMRYGHDRSGANHAQGHIIFGPDGTTWPAVCSTDAELIALAAGWD